MGILEDILKALDRIPIWKRLQIVSGSYPIHSGEPAVKARVNPVAMATTPKELKLTVRDIRRLTEGAETLRADLEKQGLPLPEKSQIQ